MRCLCVDQTFRVTPAMEAGASHHVWSIEEILALWRQDDGYATLWRLQFPRHGDAYIGCEWVEVFAQGVPAHIGTPTPGYGYEAGDPFEAFLPPAIRIDDAAAEENLRAVVFITSLTKKGTPRSGQEYESPLLMLTGASTRRCRFKTCTTRSAMR